MLIDDFYEWLARQDAEWFLRAMDPRTIFKQFLEDSALNPLGLNVFSVRRFAEVQKQRCHEYKRQQQQQAHAAQQSQLSLF